MQKRTLKVLSFSAALFWILPNTALGQDVTGERPAIQITFVNGKYVMTNSAPNAPIPIATTTQTPAASLDGKMPAPIQSLVTAISKTHGVDPKLVAAVMKVESNYDRWAKSSKGALGLMQLIPATGQRFGVRDFFDPAQNIEGGVRYLKFLGEKFPSKLDLQLAAYNAGENLVERLGRVPAIQETREYVRRIRTIYKTENGLTVLSASEDTKTEIAPASPAVPAAPPSNAIYRYVDDRGVVHFSNIGPPN